MNQVKLFEDYLCTSYDCTKNTHYMSKKSGLFLIILRVYYENWIRPLGPTVPMLCCVLRWSRSRRLNFELNSQRSHWKGLISLSSGS